MDSVPAVYASPFDEWNGPYDFTCPKCGVHFKGDKAPTISCLVMHHGGCCHYGYQVAPEGSGEGRTKEAFPE